jgi:hypothetical protein
MEDVRAHKQIVEYTLKNCKLKILGTKNSGEGSVSLNMGCMPTMWRLVWTRRGWR